MSRRGVEGRHYPLPLDSQPPGWEVVPVGDVLSNVQSGFASGKHNRDGQGVPHLRPMNITPQGDISLSEVRFVAGENPLRLAPGDVLFNNTNSVAWVGKTAHVAGDGNWAFSNHMTRLRVGEGIDPRFVARQLHYLCSRGYFRHQCKKHVNQASISGNFLSTAVPFQLPPTNEQRRIVAKIEALFERSRRAKQALDAIPPLLDKLRQSMLAAAFRGDLTTDWRAQKPNVEPADKLLERIRTERRHRWEQAELAKLRAIGKDPKSDKWKAKYKETERLEPSAFQDSLPPGWQWARADEVVAPDTVVTYGIVLPGPNLEEGIPYIRGLDIQGGKVLVDQLWRTAPEISAKHSHSVVAEGDVLLCIIRHLKVALVPPGIDGANLTQGTVRMRPSSAIRGPYLAGWLAGPRAQTWMKSKHFGLAMPRINVADARAVPIPVAPIEEQDEIVRRLGSRLALLDRLSDRCAAAAERSQLLESGILEKAFRGELVAQSSEDEPASVLLARIRPARPASRGRRRVGGKKTAVVTSDEVSS